MAFQKSSECVSSKRLSGIGIASTWLGILGVLRTAELGCLRRRSKVLGNPGSTQNPRFGGTGPGRGFL